MKVFNVLKSLSCKQMWMRACYIGQHKRLIGVTSSRRMESKTWWQVQSGVCVVWSDINSEFITESCVDQLYKIDLCFCSSHRIFRACSSWIRNMCSFVLVWTSVSFLTSLFKNLLFFLCTFCFWHFPLPALHCLVALRGLGHVLLSLSMVNAV